MARKTPYKTEKKQTCTCHFHEGKKFVMKMKIKEDVKLGASENANKRRKSKCKNINGIVGSLKSLQHQIKAPKLLLNEN